MFGNKAVNLIIVIILFWVIKKIFFTCEENFEASSSQKQKLATSILNFIKIDTTYVDYLEFLATNLDNLSENILQEENFYEFLYKKKSNSLNANDIITKLTDM